MRALIVFFGAFVLVSSQSEDADADGNAVYKIEGKVLVENEPIAEWGPQTRIIVNGGEYVGFLKPDGSFVVSNVPPGSHMVEVSSPNHGFQPARVEISSKSKGKMRARHVDWLQPGVVQQIRYPLLFKTKGKAGFFEKRETWHWTDSLMNPMVLMMLLPVLLLAVIPRLMGSMDADSQKQMEDMRRDMFNTRPSDVFDPSKWLQQMFSGTSKRKVTKKPSGTGKRK